MAIQPAARLLQKLKHWVGDGSSAPLSPQSIRLDPRSQLALLDRRAALWSGKNPLRILKQSSGHNHLVAGASTWAAVSTSSQEALRPPPTWFRCGLCLGDSMSQAPSSSPHSLGHAHRAMFGPVPCIGIQPDSSLPHHRSSLGQLRPGAVFPLPDWDTAVACSANF